MDNCTIELLQRNLHGVFGQRDALKRRQELESIWLAEGVFIDPDGRYDGFGAIDRRVAELQALFAEFEFSQLGYPQTMHGVGKLAWGFGPAGQPHTATGIDIAVTRDGKLVELYAFID